MSLGVAELIALFTGVEHEDGGWITTPTYAVPLIAEIARLTEPATEVGLRKALYGDRGCDLIDPKALYVIGLGFNRYRQARDSERAAR